MTAEHGENITSAIAMGLGTNDDNSTMDGITHHRLFEDIAGIVWTVDFAMLLLALVVGMVWFTYLTYYNARVLGFILTKVANCLHSNGRISIGSVSISLLSGKLMVGDVIYFHPDFTCRIQYVCVIFRFWRPYKLRHLGIDDFSHAESRVLVDITCLELHVYNRLQRYEELDKLFGLGIFEFESAVNGADGKDPVTKSLLQKRRSTSYSWGETRESHLTTDEAKGRRDRWTCWLMLIPRIDVSVAAARLCFGNRVLPTTLVISFDDSKARYSVKPPTNSLDEFLHTVRGSCENLKVSFVKSTDYSGSYEQPPRKMGDGFVVLQTAELQFYYYQDEPGVVSDEETFDRICSTYHAPAWGSDFRLGKGTILSYGPWAHAQTDKLYRFFFPPDFQLTQCYQQAPPGLKRTFTKYDLKISNLHDATIDVWFVPDDIPQAIHINFCQGSYCDMTVPMVLDETGYVCSISGQLMKVESVTSLAYRSLLSSETFEFSANLRYPRKWNQDTVWEFLLRGCKSSLWLVYDHKIFLQHLLNEWSNDSPPDICTFTPYTYVFDCIFEDVEAVVTLNKQNWIDTSSNQEENCRGAVCGRSLHISFTLPFVDFMPDAIDLKFDFIGEMLNLKMFFPEQNILSHPLRSLHSAAMQQRWLRKDFTPAPARWTGPATSEDGWIECCYALKGTVTLVYHLHPMPIRPAWLTLGGESEARTSGATCSQSLANLDPDKIQVELNISSCCVQLSGALVIFILSLKENYFGETQTFTEVEKYGNETVERKCDLMDTDSEEFDCRKYRPLHVSVSLALTEIEAQCLTFDGGSGFDCPVAMTDKLVFEMDKQYTETRMQLCLAPVELYFVNSSPIIGDDPKMETVVEGRVILTGFQLRGQALFSAEGLPVDSITSEYGWLLEILLGQLIGRLTLKHAVQVSRFIRTFLCVLSNDEEDLPLPKYADVCQHMWPRSLCPSTAKAGGTLCDTENSLKYRLIRVSVDKLHICLLESDSAVELTSAWLRLTHCTEHTAAGKSGADLYIPHVSVRQLVRNCGGREVDNETNTKMQPSPISNGFSGREVVSWIECGKVETKSITLKITAPQADSSYYEKRREYLLMHDQRSRRLAFLHRSPRHDYACGCVGGCVFFGDNRNGPYFTEGFAKQSGSNELKLAVPKLEPDRGNPGYGQSILRYQELLVEGDADVKMIEQSPIFEDASENAARKDEDRLIRSAEHYHEASDDWMEKGQVNERRMNGETDEHEDKTSSASDSLSRSSSYISTVSRNELNLCQQVNRPIVSSPLLLSTYGKYLDTYICRNLGKSTERDRCKESSLVNFGLVRAGLNGVSFIGVSDGQYDVNDEDEAKLYNTDLVRERIERRMRIGQSETKEATISDLEKVDIRFGIGHQCRIFVSPLGLEMMERYLANWISQCSVQHPASLVMDAFDYCSSRAHKQDIVDNSQDEKDSSGAHVPIRLSLDIPKVDLTVFQCGIVEKIVPYAHMAHSAALMPASVLVARLEGLSAHTVIENGTGTKRRRYTLNGGFDRLFFHLTQIIEKGAATIGISKNASKIGRWVDYDALHLNADNLPCVVLEGKVVFADTFVRKEEDRRSKVEKPSSDVPSAEADQEMAKLEVLLADEADSDNNSKNQLDGVLACVSIHFGLLQPLEHSGDSWPLYDLLAPSASAWFNVTHRLTSTLTAAMEAREYGRSGPFCFLLTEALNCDQLFSVRKSKFEKLKLRGKRLRECPSCQTLLALMRYCASSEFAQFQHRFVVPMELRQSNILKSATVALLSHWREVLCANKLVHLNPNAAKRFVINSPSLEGGRGKLEQEMSVLIDIDTVMDKTAPTTPVMAENETNLRRTFQLQAPKSRIESLQNLAAKFDHFAELEAQDVASNASELKKQTTLAHGNRHSPAATLASPIFTAGTGAGMDLYEWMKREQAADSRHRKNKRSRYQRLNGDEEVNPMDVPLYVYFGFFFEHLKLKKSRRKSPLFVVMGHDFVADIRLLRMVTTVNEPKYLGLAGSTLKRVTHTERPLIGIYDMALRADAKYSEELAKETIQVPLPGSKEEASPPKQAIQSIDYHVNIQSCDVTVGFPSVTFLNQVVYVIRSTKETFDELQGKRKTEENTDEETQPNVPGKSEGRVRSLSADSNPSSTVEFGQAPIAVPPSPSQAETENTQGPVDTGNRKSPEIVIRVPTMENLHERGSSRKRPRGNDSEKIRDNSVSSQQQRDHQQHWTKRMVTMLRDFQRAKRTSALRQTPTTPSPSGEPVLVTTVLGAIDCSKVEINAMFTELFAYATFKSVQLGHKSTESWTTVGPSQLRSSDKSVRGALKQINFTLSEVQSMQAAPVNVLTFSVAESNTIFRRYLQMLAALTEDAWRNSLAVEIGPVSVDIPLHAGSLHGLVVRGTKNISDRLPFLMTPSVVEEVVHIRKESAIGHYSRKFDRFEKIMVINFKIGVKQVQVDAVLLPSLKASYKMNDVAAFGETGSEAKFQVKLPNHEIAFDVKGALAEQSFNVTPKILVPFPKINAKGAYLQHHQAETDAGTGHVLDSDILYKEGGYLQIDVDVGSVQHTLTTDLLNQLLFIQEAFTSEVGEIIQKIRSEKKPAAFWSGSTSSTKKQLLYSIEVTVNSVQIMATTPTATAVRLDTENVRFHISNRLMRKTRGDALERVFGVTELNISLSLGQLVRVASHQEAEPEFQQFGYFRTGVSMRNVDSSNDDAENPLADLEDTPPTGAGGSTYLVTLYSPIIFAQPTAVDKALLLWLNYRNAYEFWNEQRSQIKPKSKRSFIDPATDASGNQAGRSVFEQLGSPPLLTSKSLFLQVSVENGLYICVPLYGVRQDNVLRSVDVTNSALVVSLRNTGIAVCSHGALVCRGRFNEFGLRFVEDFDGNAENWNPSTLDIDDPSAVEDINACFVPEGTYDICSKTINPNDDKSTAHWILNISWRMKGFDMNLNTRIWKLTSLLVSTLTSLATTESEDTTGEESSGRASLSPNERPDSAMGEYSAAALDEPSGAGGDELGLIATMVPGRNRKRILQKTYHDIVAKIRTLEQQEADELLIEKERKKLLRLEALLFSDSRRDVVTRLRRQAQKATTSLIDQWGLNVKSGTQEVDGERAGQKKQRTAEPDGAPHEQSQTTQTTRRYSEFPTRDVLRQQTRAGSMDGGGRTFGQLRQVSESKSPSPPQQTLSFDLSDDADFFSDLHGNNSRSQSPVDDERGTKLPGDVPKVAFELTPPPVDRTGPTTSARQQTPAVDLYLDLKIFVENGRCNFRSMVSKLLEQQEMGGLSSSTSAGANRKHEREWKQRKQKVHGKADRPRQSSQQPAPIHTTTIFLPGLNVKASYASNSAGGSGTEMPGRSSTDEEGTMYSLLGGKYGQLILWMSLEEMPEETVISPHILDFLEQMLEPLPASAVSTMEPGSTIPSKPTPTEMGPRPMEESGGYAEDNTSESLGLDASTLATVASFPLDIVFHLSVQSSLIRFTSQPLAQIECILRLPTLQLIGTSRKCSEVIIQSGSFSDSGMRRTTSSSGMLVRLPDDDLSGGIYVTLLMTGFSVSVFHMYSAGARVGSTLSAGMEKRDALSIHMDTVGVSLSRSRVTVGAGDVSLSASGASTMKFRSASFGDQQPTSRPSKNSVKVALVVNMGKAQFKYDMRRLHEILQFPKAWYRRTIFRRLFLGDETASNSRLCSSPSVASLDGASSGIGNAPKPTGIGDRRDQSRKVSKISISTSSSSESGSKEEDDEFDETLVGLGLFKKRPTRVSTGVSSRSAWDALVLFGVNFEELSIDAMMGQVMGETKWVFAGADCQGHFALTSDKEKSVYLTFRLARSELVARQGQVSGLMNLTGFEASAFVKKSGRMTPDSLINASLACLDIRIDWMSSPTFMARLTQLNCNLKDDWRIDAVEGQRYVDEVTVLIVGKISWDSFRILITQTTVTDIMRVCFKVKEFMDQSLQSGRMALFLHSNTTQLGRTDRTGGQAGMAGADSVDSMDSTARQTVVKRYHRHWQKALALVTSLQLEASDFFPIPKNATVLGGAVEFSGNDLALACFGSGLHSKEWLVFHLREPSIEFCTEAKDVCLDDGELAQLINQDLCFRLGQQHMKRINTHMGTVLCVSGAYAVTHSSSIDEWLDHAFTSVLNRVYRIQSPVTYKHQYKEAFYVPPFALHVKTKQIQAGSHISVGSSTQPVVESAVIADFEDHLKINVQEVLYLRRFIKAYISRQAEPAAAASGDRTRQVADPTEELQKDAREYRTTHWHVEPTIRLMSLESMETTDYLWRILGIYQYAVTVSKWLQRGFLDPLDSVMACMMEQILSAEKKAKQQ